MRRDEYRQLLRDGRFGECASAIEDSRESEIIAGGCGRTPESVYSAAVYALVSMGLLIGIVALAAIVEALR